MKSALTILPLMLLPKATARGCFLTSGNCSKTSLKATGVIFELGISNPEVYCPSTTASKRARTPPKRIEISSIMRSMAFAETLGSYLMFYLVTDGPTV